jgi:hypothetical protein
MMARVGNKPVRFILEAKADVLIRRGLPPEKWTA